MPRKKKVTRASPSAFRNIGTSYLPPRSSPNEGLPEALHSMVFSFLSFPHADVIAEFNRRRQLREVVLGQMDERSADVQRAYDQFFIRVHNQDVPPHIRDYYLYQHLFRLPGRPHGENVNLYELTRYVTLLRERFDAIMEEVDQATPQVFENIMQESEVILQEIAQAANMFDRTTENVDAMIETSITLGNVQPRFMRKFGF